MSRMKVQRVREGQIPSERIVDLRTADGGEEQVIVSDRQVQDDSLLVSEISVDHWRVLVELPREAMSGSWRVWVPRELVEPSA